MSEELKKLALELLNSGLTIGTIEHCTCGLVGASIASICATPTIYKGSIVGFDREILKKFAGVHDELVETNGLCSSQVAMQMALCGIYLMDINVCVGVVGDAFLKEDGTDGEIWICVCKKLGDNISFKYAHTSSDSLRSKNIEKAITAAIETTVKHLKNEE